MAPEAYYQADDQWTTQYVYDGWLWAKYARDPEEAAWGRRPEPSPPPLRMGWQEYIMCFLIAWVVCITAVQFRGVLLDDDRSVVNVAALVLTRAHRLSRTTVFFFAASPTTAVALLPTCPAPAVTPPVCFEWEKPAALVLKSSGSAASADTNWRSDGHHDHDAAMECFDSIVRDAAWTCNWWTDEQGDDYKATTIKCFDDSLQDAARTCFAWSDDATPLTGQYDDPPPT